MYFIDRKKITNTLQYMEKLVSQFEEKAAWNDFTDKLALERLAQNVIESIIDVGNSMIDGFIMRDPGSYEDILDILLDEKVINEAMHKPLIHIIQMRKMLVRDFISVDHKQLLEALEEGKEALRKFPLDVQRYLEDELGPVSAFIPENNE